MRILRIAFFALLAAGVELSGAAAQAAMKTQWIDYKQGNAALSGYLVYDDAVQGRRPGVLMIHDRSGFSEGTLADAEMISRLGYVVFAEDIFGKGIVPKTVPEMTQTIAIYDKDRALMRAGARAGRTRRPEVTADGRSREACVGGLLLWRHDWNGIDRNRRAASQLRLRARGVSRLHAGRREKYQRPRPDSARRRGSGCAHGRTECRHLTIAWSQD
jgi:hypothetical protein